MLTQAQQDALLDRAVEAVKAWRAADHPDTDPAQVSRRCEVAAMAVTDAVTRGGHLHTRIATLAGVPGLRIVDLIGDWSAQAEALTVERNAAERYVEQVRQAACLHAARRYGAQGHGSVSAMSRQFRVSRAAVDKWIARGQQSPHPA